MTSTSDIPAAPTRHPGGMPPPWCCRWCRHRRADRPSRVQALRSQPCQGVLPRRINGVGARRCGTVSCRSADRAWRPGRHHRLMGHGRHRRDLRGGPGRDLVHLPVADPAERYSFTVTANPSTATAPLPPRRTGADVRSVRGRARCRLVRTVSTGPPPRRAVRLPAGPLQAHQGGGARAQAASALWNLAGGRRRPATARRPPRPVAPGTTPPRDWLDDAGIDLASAADRTFCPRSTLTRDPACGGCTGPGDVAGSAPSTGRRLRPMAPARRAADWWQAQGPGKWQPGKRDLQACDGEASNSSWLWNLARTDVMGDPPLVTTGCPAGLRLTSRPDFERNRKSEPFRISDFGDGL